MVTHACVCHRSITAGLLVQKERRRHEVAAQAAAAREAEAAALQPHLTALGRFIEECRAYRRAHRRGDHEMGPGLPMVTDAVASYYHEPYRGRRGVRWRLSFPANLTKAMRAR